MLLSSPRVSLDSLLLKGFRERLLADPKFLHRLAIEGAISITTTLLAQLLNPTLVVKERNKRSPIFKTAVVYGCFLGTSANLRCKYQKLCATRLLSLQLLRALILY
ncbi:hypothetical protein MRB53_001054 [Persea americana]|uniref:Uncharacterized protein n=1 Tax=Persea americana TaxID=3435 RepID=A0ACC2MQR2_PERAE|nr:hypothetical protein MRB53_001054 [Persea americana]